MPDAPLALHDTGEGPPLLLLHAYPQDATMWDAVVAQLSDRHRCLRPDAYGCGASPPPPGELTMDSWAGALLETLDTAGVGGCTVAGLSMGGYLALALLRRAPERITALALLSSRAGADSDSARAERLRIAADLRARGRDALEDLVEPTVARLLGPAAQAEFHISDPVRGRLRRCTPAGLAACQEAMATRPDAVAELGRIACPVLVVAGERDAVAPLEEMRALASAIPGSQFAVVAGAGHLACVEYADEVSRLLAGLAAGVRTAPVA